MKDRERQRQRQREKQVTCREPDVGLDPGDPWVAQWFGACLPPRA